MMTIEVFVVVVASVAGIFAAANMYVKRSLRSFRKADVLLNRMDDALHKLIDSDVPIGVARVGFLLMGTAGCGCYVRGILYSHYMPPPLARLVAGGPKRNSPVERDLLDMNKLDEGQRRIFSELIGTVVMYDGYRNPLSGWLFRHMLRSSQPPSFTERADTEVTTVSILSRQKPQKIAVLEPDMCAA